MSLNFQFEQEYMIWQKVTSGAIFDRFLLIDDSKSDVEEVDHDEEKVEAKDSTPANLIDVHRIENAQKLSSWLWQKWLKDLSSDVSCKLDSKCSAAVPERVNHDQPGNEDRDGDGGDEDGDNDDDDDCDN